MKTNELENELGLSKHTILYYEKEGFVQPKRDENGYRNYSERDLQTLRLVKFLRNLQISIDDVKAILGGQLDFQECLRVNQVCMDKQIENLKDVKKTIDFYHDKDLPLITELDEIEHKTQKGIGLRKTTSTVSLGRRLTRPLAFRQLLYSLGASLFLSFGFGRFFYLIDATMGQIVSILIFIVSEILILAYSFKETSSFMLDDSLNQSVEFLNDSLLYYQFIGPQDNFKYFFAVLFNREKQFMHQCRYEDVEKLEIIAKKRYMKLGSPIAYEVYVADFCFYFKNGKRFYFYWPMILDDDARYIAMIVENKISNIEDKKHILEAMKKGINLNDYLIDE